MSKCYFIHNWGWPRKRDLKNMQVCLNCGAERESQVKFTGPHFVRTQEPKKDQNATTTAS